MSILALDIATTTGFAWWPAGQSAPVAGAVAFSGGVGEFSAGFDAWLTATVKGNAITHMAVEQPIVVTGKTNFRTTCRLVGAYVVAQKVAYENDLPVVSVTPGEWRRFFIGCDRAPREIAPSKRRAWLKDAAMRECEQVGWSASSDDASDALGLLAYVRALSSEQPSIWEPEKWDGRQPLSRARSSSTATGSATARSRRNLPRCSAATSPRTRSRRNSDGSTSKRALSA